MSYIYFCNCKSFSHKNNKSRGSYFITKVDDDKTCKECGYYARAVTIREYEKHGWNCVITSKKQGRGH